MRRPPSEKPVVRDERTVTFDIWDLAQLVQMTGDGLIAVDPSWNVRFINEVAERLVGRSAESVVSKSLWDVMPCAIDVATLQYGKRAIANREWFALAAYNPTFDVWLEQRCVPTENGDLLIFLRDVTQRKRAEIALSTSEARLAAVVAASKDAILCLDRDQRIVLFNPAAEAMLGWKASEMFGASVDRLLTEFERFRSHRVALCSLAAVCVPEFPMQIRETFAAVRHDGEEFPAEATISKAMLANGECLFVVVIRDLTVERRVVREQEKAVSRQRGFVRDVLYSVSDGKLRLCDRAADLPDPLPQGSDSVTRRFHVEASTLSHLRQAVREEAARCGLPEERASDLLFAVGEAAMNAVVHAGGGECLLCGSPELGTMQVRVMDKGAGIDMDILPRATLERGFTTAGTMGQGFRIILSSTDRVWLLTGASGTTIVLEEDRVPPPDLAWIGLDDVAKTFMPPQIARIDSV